jgi:uncharacterized protein (TIGR02996 family)
MTTLDALLAGIVAEPLEETRWLVLADYLEENDDPRRAELLRLHRKLLATCCEPDAHPERAAWQRRVVELLDAGVAPCVPQRTLMLPGGIPLVGAFVPPGSFLMGDTEDSTAQPVHRTTLTQGYFLGVHPVTQAQWEAVMGTERGYIKGPNRPVDYRVTCEDARAFCTALSGSTARRVELPTEAQWEWACRAGTTTHFHFGDVPSTDRFNYNGSHTWKGSKKGTNRDQTTDVGSFPPNAWGLFDLHGNVWEYCADEYAPYSSDEQIDPIGKNNSSYNNLCVSRGGSYGIYPQGCRAACRNRNLPSSTDTYSGFRVCFSLV